MKRYTSGIICDRKIRTPAAVVQQTIERPVRRGLMDDVRSIILEYLEFHGGRSRIMS
jgi:hypothetical protein